MNPELVRQMQRRIEAGWTDQRIASQLGYPVIEGRVSGLRQMIQQSDTQISVDHAAEVLPYITGDMGTHEIQEWIRRVLTATPLRVYHLTGDPFPSELEIRGCVPKTQRWRKVIYVLCADSKDALSARREDDDHLLAFITSEVPGAGELNLTVIRSRAEREANAAVAAAERLPVIDPLLVERLAVADLGDLLGPVTGEDQARFTAAFGQHQLARPLLVVRFEAMDADVGNAVQVVPLDGFKPESASMLLCPRVYLLDGSRVRVDPLHA